MKSRWVHGLLEWSRRIEDLKKKLTEMKILKVVYKNEVKIVLCSKVLERIVRDCLGFRLRSHNRPLISRYRKCYLLVYSSHGFFKEGACWVSLTLSSPGGGGGAMCPPSGFLCITQKWFYVSGWNLMTFPKILWGIFWCVFCKHLLNTVAMVTTFS